MTGTFDDRGVRFAVSQDSCLGDFVARPRKTYNAVRFLFGRKRHSDARFGGTELPLALERHAEEIAVLNDCGLGAPPLLVRDHNP